MHHWGSDHFLWAWTKACFIHCHFGWWNAEVCRWRIAFQEVRCPHLEADPSRGSHDPTCLSPALLLELPCEGLFQAIFRGAPQPSCVQGCRVLGGDDKPQAFLKVECHFLKAVTLQPGDDSGISVASEAPGRCCPIDGLTIWRNQACQEHAVLMGPGQADHHSD